VNIYELDENDRLDYGCNFRKWLAGPDKTDDDVIVSSSWVIDPGITQEDPTFDAHSTTIWLKDGVVGTTYEVTNEIHTFKGRIKQRTFGVLVVPIAN